MKTIRRATLSQLRRRTEMSEEKVSEAMKAETAPPKIEIGLLAPSVIPTMHFQRSLLRLPIPSLEDTCANYVRSVTPLLTEQELAATQKVVASFQNGEGRSLHDRLVAKDKMNPHTSYISGDWFDMYLSARSPLPLNWNPFLVFREDPVEERNTQAFRTATFIHASVEFKNALDNNTLQPEVFHMKPKTTKAPWFQRLVSLTPSLVSSYVSMAAQGYPLDMSQFSSLFNSTRKPGIMKDELFTGRGEYVIVFCQGNPYKINVSKGGKPVSVDQLAARIQALTHGNLDAPAEFPVGALTAAERTRWAKARDELELDPVNAKALNEIDNALFVICLDEDVADFDSPAHIASMGRLFLHGDPQKGNRWWDKSFSLLVSKNGVVSCNFEHSWGDGVAVMRWCNDVFHTAAASRSKPVPEKATEQPERIVFNLGDSAKNAIKSAVADFQQSVDALKYSVSVYPGLGKVQLRKMGLSADALMQQGFQLGFKKLYNETRSSYESASTAAFKHGRTEAIRAATIESKAFCEAMTNPASSPSTRYDLMQAAMKQHGKITKDALMGKGTDRHLFALKRVAEKAGDKVPELFTDRGYAVLNENIISTSTLYSDCLKLGGFGPVHAEGFGVGYSPTPNLLFLGVTSYSRNPQEFIDSVWEGVDEMEWLLKNHKK